MTLRYDKNVIQTMPRTATVLCKLQEELRPYNTYNELVMRTHKVCRPLQSIKEALLHVEILLQSL